MASTCFRGMRLSRRTDLHVLRRSALAGFRFLPDVIVLAVCWYPRFGFSYRDVEELLAERGIEVDHVTIQRWVRRLSPLSGTRGERAAGGNRQRRGFYEIAADEPTGRRLVIAFIDLAEAIG